MTRFTRVMKSGEWTFTASRPVGKYEPTRHTYRVKAYLLKSPQRVTENGKPLPQLSSIVETETQVGWFYDEAHKRLYVKTAGDNRQKLELAVR